MMYDRSTENWKKIDPLSFARYRVGVAAMLLSLEGVATTQYQTVNDRYYAIQCTCSGTGTS